MIDRRLVLCHEGAPVAWSLFASEIRDRIQDFPDDQAGSLQVWSVPSTMALSVGEDITQRFGREWSKEFEFGDGIEPADYLARFPVFVRENLEAELIAQWNAALEHRTAMGNAA